MSNVMDYRILDEVRNINSNIDMVKNYQQNSPKIDPWQFQQMSDNVQQLLGLIQDMSVELTKLRDEVMILQGEK